MLYILIVRKNTCESLLSELENFEHQRIAECAWFISSSMELAELYACFECHLLSNDVVVLLPVRSYNEMRGRLNRSLWQWLKTILPNIDSNHKTFSLRSFFAQKH